jgi:phosphoadenosine phosphosulfate reductase
MIKQAAIGEEALKNLHSSSDRVADLNAQWREIQAERVLKLAIFEAFPGHIALSSSFGAESAVLLHLVARVYRAVPVVFLETGKHFPETIEYRDQLVNMFGLTKVEICSPDEAALQKEDPNGDLHLTDHDRCCALRKVEPFDLLLEHYDAWITGRKRYQNPTREDLPIFEEDLNGKIKVNPLANWSPSDVTTYFQRHNLPPHPLVAKGYPSIGCAPCTTPVEGDEDARAGRWRGSEKTECGIHVTADGKVVRTKLL